MVIRQPKLSPADLANPDIDPEIREPYCEAKNTFIYEGQQGFISAAPYFWLFRITQIFTRAGKQGSQ
jgi:hypothetical protein